MKKTKRLTIAQRILTWFGIFVVSALAGGLIVIGYFGVDCGDNVLTFNYDTFMALAYGITAISIIVTLLFPFFAFIAHIIPDGPAPIIIIFILSLLQLLYQKNPKKDYYILKLVILIF